MEYESHIAHAIASFSELGIGAATLLIVDVAKWRAKVSGMAADPIEFNNLCVQARKMNSLYVWHINLLHWVGEKGDTLLYFMPHISLVLGFYALSGISFQIPMIGIGEGGYFGCAVFSFILSFIAAFVERSGAKVADGATAATEKDIP